MTVRKNPTPSPAKTASKPGKKPAGKTLANTDLTTTGQKSTTHPRAVTAPALLLSELRALILTTLCPHCGPNWGGRTCSASFSLRRVGKIFAYAVTCKSQGEEVGYE